MNCLKKGQCSEYHRKYSAWIWFRQYGSNGKAKGLMDTLYTIIVSWMPQLLRGARVTISLTVLALFAGLILSLFLALGKMSKNVLISKASSAYIFFFRGT